MLWVLIGSPRSDEIITSTQNIGFNEEMSIFFLLNYTKYHHMGPDMSNSVVRATS